MDKIIEKLSGVLSPEDLNEVKKAFESAVDERVQTKLDEETKNLAKKADEFCQKKIEEAVAKKTAELEDLANKYCEERCAKITEKAQKKLDSQQKKLEEAADQYICEFFDEKYKERFGQDLDDLEESLLTNLDKWLEMTISEKISPKLIQKQAVNETYEPIINAIKSAFEDQYVALYTTSSAKLREAKAEAAELRESLKKQVESGMRLSDKLDAAQKRALIAEKTRGLSSSQVSRVNKMFESKDYAETKEDIDEYVAMLNERAPIMKRPFAKPLSEKFKSNSLKVEDETQDIITEKFHPKKNLSESQDFLLKAASYLG